VFLPFSTAKVASTVQVGYDRLWFWCDLAQNNLGGLQLKRDRDVETLLGVVGAWFGAD
jgi:hypothetical protein